MSDRYWVGGMGYISPSGGTCVAQRLIVGDNVVAVSVVGTLLVNIPSGLTGHVHGDGTCNVTDDPKALTVPAAAGDTGQTTVTTSGAAGNITVTLVQTAVSNWSYISSWSAATGGISNASVPTSADSVYFNANSFSAASQTCTVNAAANCLDMVWTGATNTPTFAGSSNIDYAGNITFILAMVATYTGGLKSSGAAATFRTNGLSLGGTVSVSSGQLTFQDAVVTTSNVRVQSGTLITNNQNVTCSSFYDQGTVGAKTITLGSSIVTCGKWSFLSDLILTANTSTINCSGDFSGGGIATYNIVNLTGTTSTITGSNTFAELNLVAAKTQTITFTDGTTQTVPTASLSGDSTHTHTLQGSAAAGWYIVKTGGSYLLFDYLAIINSKASPVSTWRADIHSTNSGGNTGWVWAAGQSKGGGLIQTLLMEGVI